jgi:SAM-dependent methyltransferase
MTSSDPYAVTDSLDDSLLQVIVTRLETRGRHPAFEKMLMDYLNAMSIDAATTVLDMGCGTGVAARAIARRRDFSGRVLGIDLSPTLAQTAARLAADEGLRDRVEFRAGDSRRLDLGDGVFDAVVAHTLLSRRSAGGPAPSPTPGSARRDDRHFRRRLCLHDLRARGCCKRKSLR